MVFHIDDRPDVISRRFIRPALVLVLTLLAASICILGTVHVFAPVLVRV
ncbi:MAG: hypothetical protein KIT36_23490 [Alphaproteobacteria bacterium]|nr:hypothetical protein [Alphaproteobacteria bacterium]